MRRSDLFLVLFRFFIYPAIIVTLCLYLYAPLFDCAFPVVKHAEAGCIVPGKERDAIAAEVAPFRLLTFGDPQLEGDSSLPDPNAPLFPSLKNIGKDAKDKDLRAIPLLGKAIRGLLKKDVPNLLKGYRKRLDLWGNDLYLAHIYRSVSWWSNPTHTVVLGDLLGSQWIGDDEFRRRSRRFWKTVFRGTEKVPRSITGVSGRSERFGQDESWKNRVIAVAGNHDIGYAGDIDKHRIERFEDTFGHVNWAIRFRLENATAPPPRSVNFGQSPFLATTPELHIIVLNSMNLDDPAKDNTLRDQSRDFIFNELSGSSSTPKTTATVILTHIPLFKEAGLCTDGPFFDYFPSHQGSGIKEQNQLTKESSNIILNGLASDKRLGKAIILNGHDHEGCDTYHYRSTEDSAPWMAKPHFLSGVEQADDSLIGVREITARSMMGSFHGTTGFLSGWFDETAQEWKFEYSVRFMGIQHIWWGVHVFDLFVLALGLTGLVTMAWEHWEMRRTTRARLADGKTKKA